MADIRVAAKLSVASPISSRKLKAVVGRLVVFLLLMLRCDCGAFLLGNRPLGIEPLDFGNPFRQMPPSLGEAALEIGSIGKWYDRVEKFTPSFK